MANVLNRTTKQFLASVNTPEYPTAQWIINPDMSAVNGYPSKYWIITGDVVSLMSEPERDAIDAAEMEAMRDATSQRMDDIEDIVRALALATLDEMNLHAQSITAILNAIDDNSTLATIKTAIAAIEDVPTRTGAQLKAVIRNKLGS